MNASSAIASFVRTFLPLECPVCGGVPFDGAPNMLCAVCFRRLEYLNAPYCPGCGGELSGILNVCPECVQEGRRPWDAAFSVFQMDGFLKELIHSYKYQGRPELARALGDLMAAHLADRLPPLDLIVSTPLHWTRQWRRGYNQAALLCERLSLRTGVPTANVLRRVKRTKQQARLKRDERIRNLSSAFSVPDSTNIKNRAILLVDDVMTTGSTLAAAASALKDAGAGFVYVCSAARRQRI